MVTNFYVEWRSLLFVIVRFYCVAFFTMPDITFNNTILGYLKLVACRINQWANS